MGEALQETKRHFSTAGRSRTLEWLFYCLYGSPMTRFKLGSVRQLQIRMSCLKRRVRDGLSQFRRLMTCDGKSMICANKQALLRRQLNVQADEQEPGPHMLEQLQQKESELSVAETEALERGVSDGGQRLDCGQPGRTLTFLVQTQRPST